jgi:hypothetical protein
MARRPPEADSGQAILPAYMRGRRHLAVGCPSVSLGISVGQGRPPDACRASLDFLF